MNISVIGLGKLGLCTAACFASKGHKVYGYDNNEQFRNELRQGMVSINETGLAELVARSVSNLHYVDSIDNAIASSELTLIIVPTPSKPDGRFTNRYLKAVLEEIGPSLKKKNSFHVVDIVSTVMPQSCETVFRPMLEKLSAKQCGKDFGLVYNPEFIALGSVIHNFLNPDMVLIGISDPVSGEKVKQLYDSTCDSDPQYSEMSLTSAEIAKLSLNCYVTMKISFVNELASLCELTPDSDIDKITNALGGDSRIGHKYLKAGLGFGGPCFPRDNLAFQAFADDVGGTARIGTQVVNVNNNVPERIYQSITARINDASTIALLGLSYKPSTHIIEESQSIMLAKKLAENGYTIKVYDPAALESTREELDNTVEYFDDPVECVNNTAAICILTQWPEMSGLDWDDIMENHAPEAILYDSWRQIHLEDQSRYIALGHPSS